VFLPRAIAVLQSVFCAQTRLSRLRLKARRASLRPLFPENVPI